MKQRIEAIQLNELSDAQKQRLRELWETQIGDWYIVGSNGPFVVIDAVIVKSWDKSLPLLSIGQMIEMLSEILLDISIVPKSLLTDKKLWSITITFRKTTFMKSFEEIELCDALWQAVKEIL